MSTRWYPLYQRGNPQLRVFLPNFWLKLLRPRFSQPPHVLQFACSMEMTRRDVQAYLSQIYRLPVLDVRTYIEQGATRKDYGKGYVVKEDDTKIAFVTLPRTENFEFPNLFPGDPNKNVEEGQKSLDEAKRGHRNFLLKNRDRPGLPSWYSF